MAGRTVTLNLGGKERHLFFDLNAAGEIEEKFGIKLRLDDLGAIARIELPPATALKTILWAGLRHEDPQLTVEQVGSWVHQDNIAEVFRAFLGLLPTSLSDDATPTMEGVRVAVAEALESVSG